MDRKKVIERDDCIVVNEEIDGENGSLTKIYELCDEYWAPIYSEISTYDRSGNIIFGPMVLQGM